MQVTPRTEKEIQEMDLWQPGEYGFEVSKAEEKRSKAGNDMIELTLKVFNPEGGFKLISDYLLDSMPGKLRHASEACGVLENYEQSFLAANDFVGKTGNLKLIITKDKNGQYPDKNSVKDYVVGGNTVENGPPRGHPANMDDDIPF